jgi:SAM-dependent methyltransferase
LRVLAEHLDELLPLDASVLDVGCGDGSLAKLIGDRRPDVKIRGIDLLVREQTAIPVEAFDGSHIPAAKGAYDVVMFVDVLHHTDDAWVLLQEARRVARHSILIKDHTRNGWLAGPMLRFMDAVGNARFGVALPYNFWTREQWQAAFLKLDVNIVVWRSRLGLYPAWADWLFGRSLHFIAQCSTQERSAPVAR